VDLIVIATPHDTHAPFAIQAAQAKKHVVTDKIMCLSVAEANAMIAAARANDVLLSVFHNRRWDGDFLTLQKVIAEGLLGEVFVVESSVVRFGWPSGGWRATQRHGGGMFRDWGAHLVDQALVLFGHDVTSVWADLQFRHAGCEVESAALCHLRFASGVRYVIEVGAISRLPRPRFQVRGSLGSLTKTGLDPQEPALKEGRVRGAVDPPEHYAHLVTEVHGLVFDGRLQTLPGNYPAYYQNVADVLLRGAELFVKPEDVREAVRVIETALESARTGQALPLLRT
jgi:scyllo-inositol 2-dehydrogenase (NADP+)